MANSEPHTLRCGTPAQVSTVQVQPLRVVQVSLPPSSVNVSVPPRATEFWRWAPHTTPQNHATLGEEGLERDYLQRLGSLSLVPVVDLDDDAIMAPEVMDILAYVDGVTSLGEVLAQCPQPRLDVMRVLYETVLSGQLRLESSWEDSLPRGWSRAPSR